MAEDQEKQPHKPKDVSRRNFLKASGAAIGGAVVGGVIGGAIMSNRNKQPGAAPGAPTPGAQGQPAVDYNQALMFFSQDQFQLTEAAAERIYPKDELGPGAKELGVAYFIDHQLASPWGYNAREYMSGPFIKGEATQGNYPSIRRHELFTLGLRAMQDISQKKYQKSFTELGEAEQDEVLKMFEKGQENIAIDGATSQNFFNQLRQFTMEGVYSDPLYGGNKGMQGWKMRNYPGNQMAYTSIIDKDFVKMEPRSLHDHMAGH